MGTDPEIRGICRRATQGAVAFWKATGIDRRQIVHVVTHQHPGIPPSFAGPQEVERVRAEAEKALGIPVLQVDGFRRNGVVNVLVE